MLSGYLLSQWLFLTKEENCDIFFEADYSILWLKYEAISATVLIN